MRKTRLVNIQQTYKVISLFYESLEYISCYSISDQDDEDVEASQVIVRTVTEHERILAEEENTIAHGHLLDILDKEKAFNGYSFPIMSGDDSIYDALLKLLISATEKASSGKKNKNTFLTQLRQLITKPTNKGNKSFKAVMTCQYLKILNSLDDTEAMETKYRHLLLSDIIPESTLDQVELKKKDPKATTYKYVAPCHYLVVCRMFVHMFEVDLSILEPEYRKLKQLDEDELDDDLFTTELKEMLLCFEPEPNAFMTDDDINKPVSFLR